MGKKTQKHVPMRTCIVTREKLPKRQLARFVYISEEQKALFDPKGKARGRGANLKKDLEVFEEAVTKNAFKRAFKANLTDENIKEMRNNFKRYLAREALKNDEERVSVRIKVEDRVKLG